MRIAYIIDMDGFQLDQKFLVKELAVATLNENRVESYYYKVGNYYELTEYNQRQVRFVKNHIHGLLFKDLPGDEEQAAVWDRVESLAEQADMVDARIAYKGGHFEKDILKKLGYAHLGFNLEDLDCPKVEKLLAQMPYHLDESCNRHGRIMPLRNKNVGLVAAHCPKMEVRCFMEFVKSVPKIVVPFQYSY